MSEQAEITRLLKENASLRQALDEEERGRGADNDIADAELAHAKTKALKIVDEMIAEAERHRDLKLKVSEKDILLRYDARQDTKRIETLQSVRSELEYGL